MIEIDDLLRELSPEAPCGEDLEYEPKSDYGTLERAAQRKPEQQFGDTIIPAEEPDWETVQGLALELFQSTRDLRIATLLTRALARTEGWPGFRDGLRLIKGLLERYWEAVHPQLDPQDDNDPTFRVNTIASLNDATATLDGLRSAVLVESRAMGRFGLRDIQIASGELPAPKDGKTPPPEPQIIDAAFQDAALEQLQTVASAIGQSLETLTAIDATLLDRVGPEASPDLAALTDLITAAQKTIAPHLSQRLESAAPEDEVESSAPETENAMGDPSTTVKTPTPAGLKAINSRGDVIKAIDLICAYYAQHEPSSPIPILLERAKRLVAKDFMAILRDLAPEGIAQLEMIRGPETDD